MVDPVVMMRARERVAKTQLILYDRNLKFSRILKEKFVTIWFLKEISININVYEKEMFIIADFCKIFST